MFSSVGKRISGLPWPVLCLVLGFAAPPEASVVVAGLRLSAYRLILLATFAWCLQRLLGGTRGPLRASDGLIAFHGFWALLALIHYAGVGQGLESGGIYLIEAVGSYLIGRCYVRNYRDFEGVTALMMVVVGVMMVFAIAEAFSGYHLIRETSRAVLGGPALAYIEPRLGLHRAYASFDHPILYGIYCAGAFGLAYYLLHTPRFPAACYVRGGLMGLACFFSLSSGAFMALFVQAALIAWDRITRGIAHRWSILAGLFLGVWTILSLVSNRSPVKVLLTYATFSPGTGYNRLRIWDYGSAEAMRHPLLGIGLGDWQRPAWMVSDSMDNFWLVTAVRYGMPAFLSLAAALVVLAVQMTSLPNPGPAAKRGMAAWMTTMAGLVVAGCTVHYWNALFSLFCFLLGCGVWLAGAERERGPGSSRGSVWQSETPVSARGARPRRGVFRPKPARPARRLRSSAAPGWSVRREQG